MDTPPIWSAQDEHGNACELYRDIYSGNWSWSMSDGQLFSGYPQIALSRDDLLKLYNTLQDELLQKPA